MLPINTQGSTFVSGSIPGASFTGVVNSASFNDGCNLLLTFTQFSLTTTLSTPVTLEVTIVQDYDAMTALWTASHQFNGDANFTAAGQMASLNVVSTHESTNLPELGQIEVAAAPGTVPFARGQGPTTVIDPVSGVYRMSTTYTIVLAAGASGSVTFNLPDSGVDQASCVPIPGPAAGVSLIGLLGAAGTVRRRRN
ncbi:MAG: hypothetical protein AB7G11_09845 [Phycisphaerales bacterium]